MKPLINILSFIFNYFFSSKHKPIYRRKANLKQDVVHLATTHKNHPKPDWVIKEVIRLKALLGKSAGCRTIAHTFNRLHGNRETVGKTFVAETIKKHQYKIAVTRREIRNKKPRKVAVNDTWAMDICFYTTADNQIQPFLGILDHGSRYVMSLTTLVNRRSWTLLGYLCLAIGKYGKPNKIRTDNEIIFNSFVFKTLLKLTSITHQKTQVAAPWQNGRIERLFGTLKPLLRQLDMPDKHTLRNVLTEFKQFYNHIRPHDNLNGNTPVEIITKQYTTKPIKHTTFVTALAGILKGFYIKR